jgi:prevent-host-death family protein
MKTVTFTEFRRHASTLLTEVEQGQTVIIVRHSKPIAELIPFSGRTERPPAWKQPGIKLEMAGAELSAAILAERETNL